MEKRDTKDWYLDRDPLSVVSERIVSFVAERAGKRILDLGCATGGYARRLADAGFEVTGADINPDYVEAAGRLGIKAVLLEEGRPLPFADDSFDTVMMVEVLEHAAEPQALVAEARRVSRGNLLLTTPNCGASDALAAAGLVFEHELDRDHRSRFDRESLAALLSEHFEDVSVSEREFMDDALYAQILTPELRRKVLRRIRRGRMKPRLSFRLYAEAR